MADATTAARARIDRALSELERKILELKERPASAPDCNWPHTTASARAA